MSTEKYIAVVAKLIELTQKGEMRWVDAHFPQKNALTAFLKREYTSEFEGKRLKIACSDRGGMLSIGTVPSYSLEFVDDSGEAYWKFPDVVGLKDLYKAIETQKSGVETFMDNILKR